MIRLHGDRDLGTRDDDALLPPRGTSIVSETTSRRLFLAEALLLALPCMALMSAWALGFGGYALVGAGVILFLALTGHGGPPDAVGTALIVLALAVGAAIVAGLGIAAIGKFAHVAIRFIRGGRAALATERRHFWQGLAFAVLPLAIMLPFGWLAVHGDHPVVKVASFYTSGLVLLPPVLHLWLELRAADLDRDAA